MTTRLHITPFNPTILDAALHPSLRTLATAISFHSLQTFPENNYGYLTLPAMEAEKLKKKLHGSIVKGKKIKVEIARPDSKERLSAAAEDESQICKKPLKPSNKRKPEKRDDGTLDGTELPSGRYVKRGWTEPKSVKANKRKQQKTKEKDGIKKTKQQATSKYTETVECLFRTKTPPNRSDIQAESKKKSSTSKESKPPTREVMVHEFALNTTYPTFVRSTDEEKKVTTEFVDGKGWVDGDGEVRERPSEKITTSTRLPGKRDGIKDHTSKRKSDKLVTGDRSKITLGEENSSFEESSDWTSSSGISTDDSESMDSDSFSEHNRSTSESEDGDVRSDLEIPDIPNVSDPFATKSERKDRKNKRTEPPHEPSKQSTEEPSDDAVSKEAEINETISAQNKNEVHPLEALFKRRNPNEKNKLALEVDTSFSFFGKAEEDDTDVDEDDHTESNPRPFEPMTPFTKRDLQSRGLRSAAPTPDTAMPTRTTFWNDTSDKEMEDGGDALGNPDLQIPYTPSRVTSVPDSRQANKAEESDFAKWFWENRGENNRAWKRRRRDAAKEKRQRENRRKGMKGKS